MKLLALLLAAALQPAAAHDSWFEQRPSEDGGVQLALGTGTRFPVQESGIAAPYLAEAGCRAARLATTLHALRDEAAALRLRGAPGSVTCWAQTTPFEITLAPDKIALYLRELRAGPEQLAIWADMQSRGKPWREHYVKNARIELEAPGALPAPLGLDLLIEHPGRLQPGETFTVRVLRDGQALAGQAVELRSEDSALGIWRRSDAQGRLAMPAPAAGRWLLRTIDLRLSTTEPDTWNSRFATLAFEIGAADQNGRNFSSKALSTNQAAATAAISSEPPSSTTRR